MHLLNKRFVALVQSLGTGQEFKAMQLVKDSTDFAAVRLYRMHFTPGTTRKQVFALFLTLGILVSTLVMTGIIHLTADGLLDNLTWTSLNKLMVTSFVVTQVIALPILSLIGVWSDRFGSGSFLSIGLAVLASTLLVLPFLEWHGFSILVPAVLGLALALLLPSLGLHWLRLPTETSRGKFLGLGQFLISSLMIIALSWLLRVLGQEPIVSGSSNQSFHVFLVFLVLLICVGAILTYSIPTLPLSSQKSRTFSSRINEAKLILKQPKFRLLALTAGFTRIDQALLNSALFIWSYQFCLDQNFLPTHAFRSSILVLVFAHIAGALWAPLMGRICDNMNRVLSLLLGLGLTSIACFSTYLVVQPETMMFWIVATLFGISQGSCFIAGQTLLAEQSGAPLLGTLSGVFGTLSSVSHLIFLSVGIILYREISAWTPMIGLGIVTIGMMFYGFRIFLDERHDEVIPKPEKALRIVMNR